MQQAEIMAAQAGDDEGGEEEPMLDQTKYEPPRLVSAADLLQSDLSFWKCSQVVSAPHYVGSEQALL
jgi:hypothetical protein